MGNTFSSLVSPFKKRKLDELPQAETDIKLQYQNSARLKSQISEIESDHHRSVESREMSVSKKQKFDEVSERLQTEQGKQDELPKAETDTKLLDEKITQLKSRMSKIESDRTSVLHSLEIAMAQKQNIDHGSEILQTEQNEDAEATAQQHNELPVSNNGVLDEAPAVTAVPARVDVLSGVIEANAKVIQAPAGINEDEDATIQQHNDIQEPNIAVQDETDAVVDVPAENHAQNLVFQQHYKIPDLNIPVHDEDDAVVDVPAENHVPNLVFQEQNHFKLPDLNISIFEESMDDGAPAAT
ncbi:unnamed protein product [Linum tenue]|uniref:Uncharacterized protein n=1 Tax=Linum tenue TaxID=586396 RepID=A0AAV0GVF7_9ROSI|nr:unnamed protein product [Linum tenue]